MQSALHQTVRAWDGSYYVPRITAEHMGRAGRTLAACLFAVALLYCGSVAWDVLEQLRELKLIEVRAVLYRVSIGDALLTWLAYVFGRELLRSVLWRDRL